MRHVMHFWPSVLFFFSAARSLCFIFILFPSYEQREGGGGGCMVPDFLFLSYFPCPADHERDWSPCKVVFGGWHLHRDKIHKARAEER